MRYTRLRAAVFTPAMPYLDSFLRRHVRPDHPFRHHPMWLTSAEVYNNPSIQFDGTYGKNSERNDANASPLMVIAQIPCTLEFFNLDQLIPESEIRWQLPSADVPMSVEKMKPCGLDNKGGLEHLRKIRGFESNWWGMRKEWEARGGQILPNAVSSSIKVYTMRRLVHISMLSNGEGILKHSYVSGKTGMFRTWLNENDIPSYARQFQGEVEEHINKHDFQSPLYFSTSSLRRAGIPIKPDADPLDLSSLPLGDHFRSKTGNAIISKSSETYQQYYHLSQLILPDNYSIPPAVLHEERMNPGCPINGVSGKPLVIPELQYEALLNSPSSELASIIRCEDESKTFSSYADLASPLIFHGRSLWYLPHDVLELGGLIDVNSLPVEVSVPPTHNESRRYLYNVEQLLQPLEGYKAVGIILTMNPHDSEH